MLNTLTLRLSINKGVIVQIDREGIHHPPWTLYAIAAHRDLLSVTTVWLRGGNPSRLFLPTRNTWSSIRNLREIFIRLFSIIQALTFQPRHYLILCIRQSCKECRRSPLNWHERQLFIPPQRKTDFSKPRRQISTDFQDQRLSQIHRSFNNKVWKDQLYITTPSIEMNRILRDAMKLEREKFKQQVNSIEADTSATSSMLFISHPSPTKSAICNLDNLIFF